MIQGQCLTDIVHGDILK